MITFIAYYYAFNFGKLSFISVVLGEVPTIICFHTEKNTNFIVHKYTYTYTIIQEW